MEFRIKGAPAVTGGRIRYDVALRAIGQDLTPLAIESLEITVDNEAYIARGLLIGGPEGAKSQSNKAVLPRTPQGQASGQDGETEQKSTRAPFMRRYAPADILRLDDLGKKRKAGLVKTPDPTTLAESLRTVGRVVESKRGRLVRIVKDQRKVAFEYQDESGNPQQEEHYSLSVYKSQQEALSERSGKVKGDVWEDSK